MRPSALAAAVALLFGLLGEAQAAPAPAGCDRACLYGHLDRYLDALKARQAGRVAWAKGARITENNVALKPGDGLWATIDALRPESHRFADPKTGGVGFYGIVREGETDSPFGVRLKVTAGRIAEVETVVSRPQDAGVPFVSGKPSAKPLLDEMLKPAERSPRAEMIRIADGYFSTLQLNDGTLRTRFDDRCNRFENGFKTTNNPEGARTYGPNMALGCADQFRKGQYRYDDRLRSRRYMLVDEERGLVMSAAFIDHSGHLREYKLTDGTPAVSGYQRPHSFVLLEAFKIRNGKIEQVEAVFTTVPYRMPSPWVSGFSYE
jgi:hypothetical protein